MGLKDLIIAPIWLVILLFFAFIIRPHVSNRETVKYFIPALTLRFAGAIALGLIYQFYYGFGGDTLNYFRQGSIIYEAFIQDPSIGLKLLFANGEADPETYSYRSMIYWYRSPSEYMIIRIIGFLSLLTFNSYISIALFFASFSFLGSWLMFKVFQERFPGVTKYLAYAILFIPSIIFWGSGVLKDTISLGSLGILFWASYKTLIQNKISFATIVLVLFSAWLIYVIKIYILLCFLPAIFIWWYLENIKKIKNVVVRLAAIPFLMIFFGALGFWLINNLASSSERYNLDSLAERAYITSYDIRYYSGSSAGSGYDIGVQDGTWQSLIKLTPASINVSLFRPYIWEVRNPLMLLSALESFTFLTLTLVLFFRHRRFKLFAKMSDPLVRMSLIFALTFAFAVGVSTYNFGSLARYKIPLMPFFASALAVGFSNKNSDYRLLHKKSLLHQD